MFFVLQYIMQAQNFSTFQGLHKPYSSLLGGFLNSKQASA